MSLLAKKKMKRYAWSGIEFWEGRDLHLCGSALKQWFSIPKNADKLEFQVYTERVPNSVKLRPSKIPWHVVESSRKKFMGSTWCYIDRLFKKSKKNALYVKVYYYAVE